MYRGTFEFQDVYFNATDLPLRFLTALPRFSCNLADTIVAIRYYRVCSMLSSCKRDNIKFDSTKFELFRAIHRWNNSKLYVCIIIFIIYLFGSTFTLAKKTKWKCFNGKKKNEKLNTVSSVIMLRDKSIGFLICRKYRCSFLFFFFLFFFCSFF